MTDADTDAENENDRRTFPSGVASVDEAVAQLETAEDWAGRHAQEEMRWAGWTAVVEPLVERLAGGDERSRKRAAIALGWVGDADAVDPLAGRLRADDAASVREAAATALGEIGDGEAVDPLVDAFGSEPAASVRQRIAWALAACGGVEESVDLVESYDGPERDAVLRSATRGLATSEAGRAAAVELLLTGPLPARRSAANTLSPDDDRTATALTTALEDGDAEVRLYAAQSLAPHVADLERPSLPARLLERAAGDGPSDPVLRALVAVAAGGERGLDADPDPEVRAAAVRSLREAPGHPGVERALCSVAETDPGPEVRETARAALDADRS